jgi:4-hydroxy-2-oxoheptanedioate aldolase
MQHGTIGYEAALGMIQAISGRGCVPIVRVRANDSAMIGQMLDAGAAGVVIPMVNSPEEARQAVFACRYPPIGTRSYGPIRAAVTFGSRDPKVLDQAICAVMVETAAGLESLNEIARVPGLDVVYAGPSDLAMALGLPPGYEHEDPAHRDAIEAVLQACEKHGVIPGIHCDGGAMASRRIAQGFRMVTFVNDVALVRGAGARELADAH